MNQGGRDDIGFVSARSLEELPDYQESVWQILKECDFEFVPSLSSRNGTTQGLLSDIDSKHCEKSEGPVEYFSELSKQAIVIATSGPSAVGFLSFRLKYECDELADWSPCIYISTVCVTASMRDQGIARMMYIHVMESFPNLECNFVATRTWSTNTNHIHLLDSLGFKVVKRLKNHRGEGRDTLYYVHRL